MFGDKNTLKILGFAALLCGAAPTFAGNVLFLKDSALAKMTDDDIEILRAAARNALNYIADGQSRRWENPETGSTGVLTPLATFDQDGTSCRRLELYNEVKGTTGRSIFVFCLQPDGAWKVPAKSAASSAASK